MKTKFHCLEKWKAITWDRVKSWSNAPDLGISLFVLDHQRVYLLWVVGNVCCFSRWLSRAFQGEPPPSPGLLFREKGTHLRGLFEAVLPITKQHGVVRARGPQIHPSIHPSVHRYVSLVISTNHHAEIMLTRAQKIGFLWFVTVWSVRFDKMCMDVWICDGCVYIYSWRGNLQQFFSLGV